MKRNRLLWLGGPILAMAMLFVAPGCVVRLTARPAFVVDTEPPPPQGPGGELPVKLPHGELPPATQIPPTTGHIVPTDR